MVGEPVEERGGHLGVAEDGRPLTERQVGCDDDRGPFIELADQVKQELATGLVEREIAKLVEDQEVEAGDQVCGPPLSFSLGFCIELVDQIYDVEEPSPSAVSDASARDADREM